MSVAGRKTAETKRMETRPARDEAPEPGTASQSSRQKRRPNGQQAQLHVERGQGKRTTAGAQCKRRGARGMASKDVGSRTVTRGHNNHYPKHNWWPSGRRNAKPLGKDSKGVGGRANPAAQAERKEAAPSKSTNEFEMFTKGQASTYMNKQN